MFVKGWKKLRMSHLKKHMYSMQTHIQQPQGVWTIELKSATFTCMLMGSLFDFKMCSKINQQLTK